MGNVVYYAVRESDGAIKIGTSNDVARRLTELAESEGCDVVLLATQAGDHRLESRTHALFQAERLTRDGHWTEWFRSSDRLAAHIARLVDKPDHVKRARSSYASARFDPDPDHEVTDYPID